MTRKHFAALASALRQTYPVAMPTGTAGDLASDYYSGRVRGWNSAVIAAAEVCAQFNGAFDYNRFYEAAGAAGFIRRTDGSMFPVSGR